MCSLSSNISSIIYSTWFRTWMKIVQLIISCGYISLLSTVDSYLLRVCQSGWPLLIFWKTSKYDCGQLNLEGSYRFFQLLFFSVRQVSSPKKPLVFFSSFIIELYHISHIFFEETSSLARSGRFFEMLLHLNSTKKWHFDICFAFNMGLQKR